MSEQDLLPLLVDLHRHNDRQGPGGDEETLRALELCRFDKSAPLQVADIGCGTGASTLILARALSNAHVTAIDLLPDFLDTLMERAKAERVESRVSTLEHSMDSLSFEDNSFDLIWSEGAIYNIGFRAGVTAWNRFLRDKGILAVSEITWLSPNPPQEIRRHWESEYPEIATASEKIATLEQAGFDLIGYFVLPPHCWTNNYYLPLKNGLPAFLERHANNSDALQIAELEQAEAALYDRFQEYFSYGFYLARKRSTPKE